MAVQGARRVLTHEAMEKLKKHAATLTGEHIDEVGEKIAERASEEEWKVKAEAEHRTIRAQAVQNLAIIQKVMDEQNAYIKALDTSFALRERQTEDTRQQLLTQNAKIEALSEAKDADTPMTAVPAVITPVLAHDTIDSIRTTLQSFLDGLLSDTPTAPSDTVARLTEVISTLPSTSAPASSFGPAPTTGTLTKAREASQPYAVELNQDKDDKNT